MSYIGIDVSKASLEVSDVTGDHRNTFVNTSKGISHLLSWLDEYFCEGVQLVIEPTNTYHQVLVKVLAEGGIPYSLINPSQSAAYARVQLRRAKTDKVDAQMLAALGKSQELKSSLPPEESQEQLKSLERHLGWLEKEIRATLNRQEAANFSPWTPQAVKDSLDRTIKQLEEESKQVKGVIKEHYQQHEKLAFQVELLTSIPGVGERTALMLLSELPPVQECSSSKSWVAFCGLNPEPRESGKSSYSRLCRTGNSRVRAKLYLPAASALRFNPAVRALGMRLKDKGKSGRARVVAAMHKLLRICYGVLKSGIPFDLSFHFDSLQT